MKKLNSIAELKNIEPDGIGFLLLDADPGAFIVHEYRTEAQPGEIARFVHDGTAHSRNLAYGKALTALLHRQSDVGPQCGYKVLEEVEIPDGGLSGLTADELREVIRIAKAIPKDIRRKKMTLRVLRTLERADSPDNPWHTPAAPLSERVWRPVFLSTGERLNATIQGMDELVKRALALLCPFNIGDRVIYGDSVCLVTAIISDGRIVLERKYEVTTQDIRLAEMEPARDVAMLGHTIIAADIEREANDPRSTKPTARGYLAALIASDVASANQNGKRFGKSAFLYHLDNCCAYGVLHPQDHVVIAERLRAQKIADFRGLLEMLGTCLLSGTNIANALLAAIGCDPAFTYS